MRMRIGALAGLVAGIALLGIGGVVSAQGTTGGYCVLAPAGVKVPVITYVDYQVSGSNYNWTLKATNLVPNNKVLLYISTQNGGSSAHFLANATSATQVFAFTTTATASKPAKVRLEDYPVPDVYSCISGFADVSSLPYGQLPEVPLAAGLPVLALAVGAGIWYRRQRRA